MLYRNGYVCRPLLDESRQRLRDYLAGRRDDGRCVFADDQGNVWREDSTNESAEYFRNYVRHKIVPRAVEKNPKLLDTLCRTMNLIADEDDYLAGCANAVYEKHVAWLHAASGCTSEYHSGCVLSPLFGKEPPVLQRRVALRVLQEILGAQARVETASVQGVCQAYDQGKPIGGYVANIQGDLAISANGRGVLIEPMRMFRARRKKGRLAVGRG